MANLGKLKGRGDKGAPPPAERTNENLRMPDRSPRQRKGYIQFSVPVELRDEFAMEAGRRFGFKKGSKSDLFIAIWEEYKGRVSRNQ